jgi:hypothetical protein
MIIFKVVSQAKILRIQGLEPPTNKGPIKLSKDKGKAIPVTGLGGP